MSILCTAGYEPPPTRACSSCNTSEPCHEPYSPGIRLFGDAPDRGMQRTWLDQLKATPTGNRLLARLDRAGASTGSLEIRHWRHIGTGPAWQFQVLGSLEAAEARGIDRSNPRRPRVLAGAPRPLSDCIVGYANLAFVNAWNPAPAILGHELIHALHYAEGVYMDRVHDTGNLAEHDARDGGRARVEEIRTVGLREWAWEELNENRIRRELGAPQRVDYGAFPTRGE